MAITFATSSFICRLFIIIVIREVLIITPNVAIDAKDKNRFIF